MSNAAALLSCHVDRPGTARSNSFTQQQAASDSSRNASATSSPLPWDCSQAEGGVTSEILTVEVPREQEANQQTEQLQADFQLQQQDESLQTDAEEQHQWQDERLQTGSDYGGKHSKGVRPGFAA